MVKKSKNAKNALFDPGYLGILNRDRNLAIAVLCSSSTSVTSKKFRPMSLDLYPVAWHKNSGVETLTAYISGTDGLANLGFEPKVPTIVPYKRTGLEICVTPASW